MQIAIIGARNMANMARGIATRAPVGGHTVTVTAKDPAKAARLAGELGAHARNPEGCHYSDQVAELGVLCRW
ncbi:hypothetical protein [Streptomyces milbemycinicus]|uniref:hypothetical protein n=1 Tax=Streptomyces milbemycinicus TaxID=476552 RepID=UPI0033E1E424